MPTILTDEQLDEFLALLGAGSAIGRLARVAASACTSVVAALEWLDYSDAVAIELAERRLAAPPYTETTLPYSLH
jgi:hypothetical protein